MAPEVYNPDSDRDKAILAERLIEMLVRCGFSSDPSPAGYEAVYCRPVHNSPSISVKVYTTIVGDAVRGNAQDAIRVTAVYNSKNGPRPVGKAQKRVYRRGDIQKIVDRTYERMREVYKIGMHPECCDKCGAPMFTSKRKNLVCADACWAKS